MGLLRSIDKLSAADASQAVNDGATIAAHAQHLRYGLSLMNRWAAEGGNPFADAKWDEAWNSQESLTPKSYDFGPFPVAPVAVPGSNVA